MTYLLLQTRKLFQISMLAVLGWLLGVNQYVYADAPKSFQVTIKPPNGFRTVEQVIEAILGVVVVIATPIVVFFIIYAGFLYVTARGNAQQVEQATRQLTYAIIGAILILGAVAFAGIIKQLVSAFQ